MPVLLLVLLLCLRAGVAAAADGEPIDEWPCDETVFNDPRFWRCDEDVVPILDMDSEQMVACDLHRLRVRTDSKGRLRVSGSSLECNGGPRRLRLRLRGSQDCSQLDGVVVDRGRRLAVHLVPVSGLEDQCDEQDDGDGAAPPPGDDGSDDGSDDPDSDDAAN